MPPSPPPQKKFCNIVHARKQIPTEYARKLTDIGTDLLHKRKKGKYF